MGGFRRYDDWYPPSRPLAVEGGIRARSRQFGETWWSRRFLDALESLHLGARLQRGRSYARTGQVLELEIAAALVTARVQGSRVRPYRVTVAAPALSEEDWGRVEAALAAQAIFSAKLLAGEMPHDIEDAFAACGLTLFPSSMGDLVTDCSCPDWSNPCKHIAAVLYLLAEAFDADPFQMLAWRGRDRDDLLDRLRALRGGAAGEPGGDGGGPAGPLAPHERLGLDVEAPPLAESLDGFWRAGADLAALRARPRRAALPDLLLRELDRPPLEVRGRNLADLLAPAYEAMTTAAAHRATADPP